MLYEVITICIFIQGVEMNSEQTIALSKHEHKPLQVNPIKHSQPMGAALAYSYNFV